MSIAAPPGGWLLLVAALVFAVATGVNDGATLLALGSRVPGLSLLWTVAILAAAVVVTPLVLGTAVAQTFLNRLVDFGDQLPEAMLVAVGVALAVVVVLGMRGIPTSLTVATLGGIVGAGVGQGLEVHWATVLIVVVVALTAPLLGAAVAFGVIALAARVGWRGGAGTLLRRSHVAALALQSVAYGANDGQKMLAVFAAAAAATGSAAIDAGVTEMVVIGVFFTIGTLVGLRRYGRTIGLAILPTRPLNAVVAEASAGAVVTATGLLGSPVSSTQTLVTSLVGSGLDGGYRRIRWQTVLAIAAAWVTTFPLAVALGAAIGWVIGAVA